jgi:hypothetical protein
VLWLVDEDGWQTREVGDGGSRALDDGEACRSPVSRTYKKREEVGLGWHRWSSGALTEDRDGDLGSGSGKRLPWQSS